MADDVVDIYSGLKGIPIDHLVATPLLAAARGNMALAQVLQEFVYTVGYENGEPPNTNLVKFDLARPVPTSDDPTATETVTVNVPLLALVPLPALLVDRVTIDFTTTTTTITKNDAGIKAKVGASYGVGALQASASLSAHADHMRTTNQGATYTFRVEASQQRATEGMSKMVDIFAATIVPVPTSQQTPSQHA